MLVQLRSKLLPVGVALVVITMAFATHAAYTISASQLSKIDTATLSTSTANMDRFIVHYASGSGLSHNPSAAIAQATSALSVLPRGQQIMSMHAGPPRYLRHLAVNAELIQLPVRLSPSEARTFMAELAKDPQVIYVEPDVIDHAVDVSLPNDPLLTTRQWHLTDPRAGINAPEAWAKSTGKNVTVAVIDTGITRHPDLDTSLADAGYDFISTAAFSGRTTDGRIKGGWDPGDWTENNQCGPNIPGRASSWHGTHTSGTIAELTNNGIGGAGVAYDAKVLPIRALGHCGGYRSDIADAIVWASGGTVASEPDNAHPAQVISMSLGGGGGCSPGSAYGQAISGAIRRGAIVVVAAGNDGDNVAFSTPANCPGTLVVGATGITTKRAFYSNWGPKVDIAAPGGGIFENDDSSGKEADNGFIWQTLNTGKKGPETPAYGGEAGTSMATPHVAGVVALVLAAQKAAKQPLYDADQMRLLLQSTSKPFLVVSDPEKPIGPGIVNAAAAVTEALSRTHASDNVMALTNRVPVGDQGSEANARFYSIMVPAGKSVLNIRTMGGTGDSVLYVGQVGEKPRSDHFFRKSDHPGNFESITILNPSAGTYYVAVNPAPRFTGLTVLATY